MTTSSDNPLDHLVDDYLQSAARAFAALPPEQAAELLADLRDHIAEERAALDPETEAGVRDILDRLGDPKAISEEARRIGSFTSAPPATGQPGVPATPPRPRRAVWPWVVTAAATLACLLVLTASLFLVSSSDGGPTPGHHEPFVPPSAAVPPSHTPVSPAPSTS